MKTMFRILAALALLALASGCLVRESHHTLYLAEDGSVTWTVLERDVRSDEREPADREREEQQYLAEVRAERHLAARALDGLWPRRLETVLLRAERPFRVHTTARFDDAAELVERGLRRLELRGDVWIEHGEGWSRIVIEVRPEDLEQLTGEEQQTPELLALLLDVDHFEIRLAEGEFIDARGFELRDGGTLAVPIEVDDSEAERNGGVAVLSLTWPVRRCGSGS